MQCWFISTRLESSLSIMDYVGASRPNEPKCQIENVYMNEKVHRISPRPRHTLSALIFCFCKSVDDFFAFLGDSSVWI